jgi:hypothetical protein
LITDGVIKAWSKAWNAAVIAGLGAAAERSRPRASAASAELIGGSPGLRIGALGTLQLSFSQRASAASSSLTAARSPAPAPWSAFDTCATYRGARRSRSGTQRADAITRARETGLDRQHRRDDDPDDEHDPRTRTSRGTRRLIGNPTLPAVRWDAGHASQVRHRPAGSVSRAP